MSTKHLDLPAKKALVLLGRQERIEDDFIKAIDALPKIELNTFSDASFNPTEYINSILSKSEFTNTLASEKRLDLIRHLQSLLISSQKQAINETQRGVYTHCADYIEAGKELSRFSTDMIFIKSMLHDISVIAQSSIQQRARMQYEYELGKDSAPNSIASIMIPQKGDATMAVENISVLDDLLVNVKGLKDALDKQRSRRILLVTQGPQCHEIDSESRHVKPVDIYVFSDLILIITKIKGSKRYQIQENLEDDSSLYTHNISHILPLKELQIKDISMIGDVELYNAFQLVYRASHFYIFQTDVEEGKRYWMQEIQKSISKYKEEEQKMLRKSRKNRELMRLSVISSDIAHQPSIADAIVHIDAQILKELDDGLSVLEMDIAILHYEQAIEQRSILLNNHKEQSYLTARTVNDKLQILQARFAYCEHQLESFILHELVNTVLSKNRTCLLIRWSAMLNIVDKALSIFLNTQKDLIKQRTKKIKFYGNIRRVIEELSRLTVEIIIDSNERLQSAMGISLDESSQNELIPKNRFCYVILLWTRERIEEFTTVFITNVFQLVKGDLETIEDCIKIVKTEFCLLTSVGLDMMYIFQERVDKQIQIAIMQAHISLESSLSRIEFVDHFLFEHKAHPLINWSR